MFSNGPLLVSLLVGLLLPSSIFAQSIPTIQLPPLTGSSSVGTISLPLHDPTRDRTLMITLYYPISNSTGNYTVAKQFTPPYAQFIQQSFGVPAVIAETILTRSYLNAPIKFPRSSQHGKGERESKRTTGHGRHDGEVDILLYSPGYGGSRNDYSAISQNLASQQYTSYPSTAARSLGHIVIAMDHPNDTILIDYQNGTTLFSPMIDLNSVTAAEKVEIRVRDVSFLLNNLREKVLPKIPGWQGSGKNGKRDCGSSGCGELEGLEEKGEQPGDHRRTEKLAKWKIGRIGMAGHSLGGASSATAMLRDRRVRCGANVDGEILGDVVQEGVRGDFLIVAAESHNRTTEASWVDFWKNSKGGWEKEISVKGAAHGSFIDFAYLYGVARKYNLIPELPADILGTIDGSRVIDIQSAYLGAFFQKCFDRKNRLPKLLQGPSTAYPEVTFWPSL